MFERHCPSDPNFLPRTTSSPTSIERVRTIDCTWYINKGRFTNTYFNRNAYQLYARFTTDLDSHRHEKRCCGQQKESQSISPRYLPRYLIDEIYLSTWLSLVTTRLSNHRPVESYLPKWLAEVSESAPYLSKWSNSDALRAATYNKSRSWRKGTPALRLATLWGILFIAHRTQTASCRPSAFS